MNPFANVKQLISRQGWFHAQPLDAALPLWANFSWTLVGNVVYAACQWAMLVVLAKLGTPEMVGEFALALAVTAPVIMFANLQLRAIQATDAKKQYQFGDYLGLRLTTTLLALLFIIGITVVTGYRPAMTLVILVVGLAKAFESLSDVFYGLFQQHEWMARIAKSMMIKGPLSLLALGSGVALTHQLLWGAVGLAVSWGVILVCYDIPGGALVLKSMRKPGGAIASNVVAKDALRPRWKWNTLARLVWLALPLGIATLLISLTSNLPLYAMQHYWGERELGFFAAMASLMMAGNLVVSALGQSAVPRLAKHYADGDDAAFRGLLLRLVGAGALLGMLGVVLALVAGRQILTLLYRPEYANYPIALVWLMVAAAIYNVASLLGYGMTAARYFRPQMPLFAVVAGVVALGCLWLVPRYGVQGAALALVMSALTQLLGSAGVVVRALSVLRRHLREERTDGRE
jgi:O-antigen/teichoic acid export membrane protein